MISPAITRSDNTTPMVFAMYVTPLWFFGVKAPTRGGGLIPQQSRGLNKTPSATSDSKHQLLEFAHTVQSVERGNFITFRERWIVEDRIHKIIKLSAQRHHGLADVQQFAGALADDVDAEDGVG